LKPYTAGPDAYSNLYRIPSVELKPARVDGLFHRVYSLFRKQLGGLEENQVIQCEDPEMTLTMDEGLIEQVLINLVKNSLEATDGHPEPSVIIHAGFRDGIPVIAVTDNGSGIPSDQIENIFVPFYSTKEGGTGVGLSFSQHVMRLHHGQLKVHSQPGSGSEFLLLFPMQ
jgi:two-component system nitrogen regulation sensor histidine kinase NtrY